MKLTLIEALCIIKMAWETKEEKELFDIAYDVVRKESKILHLQYQQMQIENKLETFKQQEQCKCGKPRIGGYSCQRTDCNQTFKQQEQ
jgi:hypothetical protein